MCGENFFYHAPALPVSGSPPRVRGKHDVVRGGARDVGITPACAGKTLAPSPPAGYPEDHPRVCGENCFDNANGNEDLGSPPRVRGKLLQS